MEEMELRSVKYRIGRLDAFKQLHVSRRLAPMFFALGQGAAAAANRPEPSQLAQENDDSVDPTVFGTIVEAFKPVAAALSKMPDDDVEYVIKTCLGVVERQSGAGWAKVLNGQGHLMFNDLEMSDMIQLTRAVIQRNLGNFFPEPPAAGRG